MAAAPRITDYASLLAAATRWLKREGMTDEVTDELPAAVQLLEAELYLTLRVWQMQQRARTVPQPDSTVLLPDNYLAARYVAVFNGNGTLAGKVQIVNSDVWLDKQAGPATGVPKWGIIRSHRLWFAPGFSEGQVVELDYYAKPAALGEVGPGGSEITSNEILYHYPNLYLFGTLAQTGDFAEEPAVQRWQQRYMGLLSEANRAGITSAVGPTPSMGMPR